MRYLGYEVCLLACRIAGVPDRQCNAFHRAQTCQPEGDSRSGFLPAGLPSFPVPRRAQRLLVFSFDYSACVQPIASASLAAYCSASSARAEFLQRVRRLLTGGSLRPACALGGNRLASLFQDEVMRSKWFVRDRRMDRAARLRVNQGEAEGVYDCTRPRMSPQICPQDCPRGAAAGCIFHKR